MATITITINTESDSDLKDSLSLILGLIEGKKLGEKKTAADLIEPSPDTTPLPPSSPVKENQIELPGYAVCNTCHVYKKIVAKGKCGYCYQKERAFLKEEERKKKTRDVWETRWGGKTEDSYRKQEDTYNRIVREIQHSLTCDNPNCFNMTIGKYPTVMVKAGNHKYCCSQCAQEGEVFFNGGDYEYRKDGNQTEGIRIDGQKKDPGGRLLRRTHRTPKRYRA